MKGMDKDADNTKQPGTYTSLPNVPPTAEVYEGDLLITAHQAMEVLARKVGLKYEAGEGNDVYLHQLADAMLTTLKKHNSNTDIVVMRKR